MNRATAANVAKALVDAGYAPTIHPGPDINSGWRITVDAGSAAVTAADVAAFATAQGVSALVRLVELT